MNRYDISEMDHAFLDGTFTQEEQDMLWDLCPLYDHPEPEPWYWDGERERHGSLDD
ncbi:MAG: hypothetical protein ACR2RE_03070 [Geminicoccaceae bacterium]